MYLKKNRITDRKYLDSYRDRKCCVCGNPNSVAHHIRYNTDCGIGIKPDDSLCIPLCTLHHDECHRHSEERFYNKYSRVWGDNVIEYAKNIYKEYKK